MQLSNNDVIKERNCQEISGDKKSLHWKKILEALLQNFFFELLLHLGV